jgi:hypothetical protein
MVLGEFCDAGFRTTVYVPALANDCSAREISFGAPSRRQAPTLVVEPCCVASDFPSAFRTCQLISF